MTFATDRSGDSLEALATRHFAEAVLASQSNVELLELGPPTPRCVGSVPPGDAAALAQALGKDRNVSAVFLGNLKMSTSSRAGWWRASGIFGWARKCRDS